MDLRRWTAGTNLRRWTVGMNVHRWTAGMNFFFKYRWTGGMNFHRWTGGMNYFVQNVHRWTAGLNKNLRQNRRWTAGIKKKHQWTKATKDTTKARTAGMNHVTEGIGERTRRHKKAIQNDQKFHYKQITFYRWTAGVTDGHRSPAVHRQPRFFLSFSFWRETPTHRNMAVCRHEGPQSPSGAPGPPPAAGDDFQ